MKLIVDDDLREICRRIVDKTDTQGMNAWVWNEDEFQVGHFCGGYVPEDADCLAAFWFSFYAPDGHQYIFKMTFSDVGRVLAGSPFDPPLEYWKPSPLGPY